MNFLSEMTRTVKNFFSFFATEVTNATVYTARFCGGGVAVRQRNGTFACKCRTGYSGAACSGKRSITNLSMVWGDVFFFLILTLARVDFFHFL